MAAIYMWPIESEITLTTTLYPIDVTDAMSFGIRPTVSTMSPVANDSVENTYAVFGGTNVQKRWFYTDGPYDDSVENTYELFDGTNIQKRWFYTDGPYEDSVENTYALFNGTNIRKKVLIDTPDEKLYFGIRISTQSVMELI